jgi:hypothetical protein
VACAVQGEHFILRRSGIDFTAKDSANTKLKGRGELHVSTIRMVFIPSGAAGGMQAFDIPMANISGEKFNQPIFGANNLSGVVAALPNAVAGVVGSVDFKLTFNEGGCATFLQVFFKAIAELRAIPTAVPVASAFSQSAAACTFVNAAIVDPNDPSVVYAIQPDVQTAVPVTYPVNNMLASAVQVATVVEQPDAGAVAGAPAIQVATVVQ